jgi:hypothetical protein
MLGDLPIHLFHQIANDFPRRKLSQINQGASKTSRIK